MIDVERFDHVSIVVTDLTRAREFYGGILGLGTTLTPGTATMPCGFGTDSDGNVIELTAEVS